MLVSAISATQYQARKKGVNPARVTNKNNKEETTFNQLPRSVKKNKKKLELQKVFENINEWKYFCHKQIEKGNLDIVL